MKTPGAEAKFATPPMILMVVSPFDRRSLWACNTFWPCS